MTQQTVILCRCPKDHKLFGIRADLRTDGEWERAWAFKINEKSASREGFGSDTIPLPDIISDEYPGCPYCGQIGVIVCGNCGKLTCAEDSNYSTCEWCGNRGKVVPLEKMPDMKCGSM